MEKIGKHNYEAYWLDHIEGNLDEAATIDLFAFLEQNPELKADLAEYESVSLTPDELDFDDKQALKQIPENTEEKIVTYLEGQLSGPEKILFEQDMAGSPKLQQLLAGYKHTFLAPGDEAYPAKMQLKKTAIEEEEIVAYMEGHMSPAEAAAFANLLASDEVARFTLEKYKQTYIKADTSVVFPDKEALKRREAKVVGLFTYRRALSIAASVVLLFGLFWLLGNKGSEANLPAEGSIALEKMSSRKKDTSASYTLQNSQVAVAPGIQKTVRRTPNDKLPLIVQPDNNVPQPLVTTTVQAVDPGKTLLHSPEPQPEPHSLIALNPYSDKDATDNNTKEQLLADPRSKPSEYVAQQINKAAWGEEEEDGAVKALRPEKKKVKAIDVLALIGKGLKKLGNQRSDAKKIEDEEKEYTEYIVTIGSLSVSKKVAN